MPKITRNFLKGTMNKSVDERLVPNGQVIHAVNMRFNSTESADKGVGENSIGNTQLSDLRVGTTPLSANARAIGAFADNARNTIYWFVHDDSFPVGATGKCDLVVSLNVISGVLTYHIISIDDGQGVDTTLNFNPNFPINAINMVDDLLFFTDDLNNPRVINIKRDYPVPALNIDQFTDDNIAVIKPPPAVSLVITPVKVQRDEGFLLERFVCFAYRYRYEDDEYSATTPFTNPIFIAEIFGIDTGSFTNSGMLNSINAAIIAYNTGGSDVIGIDILYKEADNNIIKVLQRIEKRELNIGDNITQTITFDNQRIFTILPDQELLRTFDNIPRKALAQTIMGNRLVYGNYLEGYDLLDEFGNPLRLLYDVVLNRRELGDETLGSLSTLSVYNFGAIVPKTVANSAMNIDLSSVSDRLNTGALISIDFTIEHKEFDGAVVPTDTTGTLDISFTFVLLQDYNSVFELVTSPEFQQAIGLPGEIEVAPNYCDGIRLTDQVNCAIPVQLNNFVRTGSGVNATDEPIQIFASPSASSFSLQLPATRFVDSVTSDIAFEYYEIVSIEARFQQIGDTSSLHSNRGYEVGIVYMDKYKRSSTVLRSVNDDTLFLPCATSITKNSLRVTIPPDQRPPAWADTFKFAIKSDRHIYETIYSTFFVKETETVGYFLLDGENARKAEEGDRLQIKTDSAGPLLNCSYVSILEKTAQASNFLGNSFPSPAGVYIKLSLGDLSATLDPTDVVDQGRFTAESGKNKSFPFPKEYPILLYPVTVPDPNNPGTFLPIDIPAGSRIVFNFEFARIGTGSKCEERRYTLRKTYISSGTYASFEEWFEGDNIKNSLGEGTASVGGSGGQIFNTYITPETNTLGDIPRSLTVNYWRFRRDTSTGNVVLMITGTSQCGPNVAYKKERRVSTISGRIQIFKADNTFVFETEPTDTVPNLYFEGNQIFDIDTLRQHQGNVQNQVYNTSTPAIIDLNFANCYTFGNGVESYKIRDSIRGKAFGLGNRALSEARQEYKEIRRFADLTYSGVYNDETNVNKLNEFNLGLLNFKQLERIYGAIQVIDGLETDIRALQEDKISYVLAGKNLISDSTEGGVIASVPEVLGTQIARVEDYGISNNPESYAKWGQYVFFTDAKRGSVLSLSGRGRGEQLVVISDDDMGPWFRDMFIEKFTTQKIGCYDPYMNEYVLVSNEREKEVEEECISCGQVLEFFVTAGEEIDYCVNVGATVGLTRVDYTIITTSGPIEITSDYDGNIDTSGETGTSGQFEFNKSSVSINRVAINIRGVAGNTRVSVRVNCPSADTITVFNIAVNNSADGGQSIHNEYRYQSSTFISSLQSNFVEFISGTNIPLVSQYIGIIGKQGTAAIPSNGSTVRMIASKKQIDTFNFDVAQNNFRFLRSNTLYANTEADMQALIAASSIAGPLVTVGDDNYAEFIMPTTGQYLYLLWDYRTSFAAEICYDTSLSRDLCCCGCEPNEI